MIGPIPTRARAVKPPWRLAFSGLLGVALLVGPARAADDGKGVLIIDLAGDLVPAPPPGPIPGRVYNHYDARLDRRVWAIYEGEGRFSIAMSAGSCQPARVFGFESLSREALDVLRRRDPRLAEEVSREGTEVFLKLGTNERWTLVRTKVPLIYNAETGERWEMQFGKYRPVGHLGGFSWLRTSNPYVPPVGGTALRDTPDRFLPVCDY